MKVKCDNCGMVYLLQPFLGNNYDYPPDYQVIDKCPKCGSNAYTGLGKDITTTTGTYLKED